jgi:hypothetical protein
LFSQIPDSGIKVRRSHAGRRSIFARDRRGRTKPKQCLRVAVSPAGRMPQRTCSISSVSTDPRHQRPGQGVCRTVAEVNYARCCTLIRFATGLTEKTT